jgi:hypothetical protein
MSTYEEMHEDGKRDAAYEEYLADRPDPCDCGCSDWRYVGCDPHYGADADGRRGVRLTEWECPKCGNVVESY